MYVIVRMDLAPTYRCVQGAHALSQYSLEFPKEFKKWNNTYLIFLGVWNLIELRAWIKKLHKTKKKFSIFHEPDLENHPTAICCYDLGRIFNKLNLA